MEQTEHYHTFQSEGTTNKPEVNKHKTKFNFPKTRLLLSEHLTSGVQTILFHSSNTCVWFLKQYCFTPQTILFHPGKSNLWNVKVKCFDFHSLEDGMGLQFVL